MFLVYNNLKNSVDINIEGSTLTLCSQEKKIVKATNLNNSKKKKKSF